MPKEALTEWILEMVTTSQRAASIVGDLMEEASNRSALWFWLSSLKIFASHLLQDIRSHWLRMMWLGFSGLLEFLILSFILQVLSVEKGLIAEYYLRPFLNCAILPLIGLHLAKRSHGSELASGVAFICITWIFMVLFNLPGMLYARSATFLRVMLRATPYLSLVIFGASLFRYRMNSRYRKLQAR